MKKKLLVLLGAGSSVEQDFPSTAELDAEVRKWAKECVARRAPDPIDEYAARTGTDFFDLLWRNREAYCADFNDDQKAIYEARTKPNYERILGDLHALMNGVLPKPYGDPLFRCIPKAEVFASLRIAPDCGELEDLGSNKVFHAVQGQLQYLSNRLAERIRGNSNGFEISLSFGRGEEQFEPYRKLLQGLQKEFELGVYNLNYDTVALTALPNTFVGFNRESGRFLAAEVLRRPEWNFVYHLHGSIHHWMHIGSHVMEDPDFGPRIRWQDDLTDLGGEDWVDSYSLAPQSDGKRVLLTSLVAGGWKLDQLQEEPFLTLYSSLTRHVHEADAILIGGYGFGDSHVNSVLCNVLRARQGCRPPVLILDYEPKSRTTAKRYDAWAIAMSGALRVPIPTFRSPCERAQKQWTELPDTVPEGEFERSLKAPVAVWNQGFTAAAGKLPQIIRWLDGEETAL